MAHGLSLVLARVGPHLSPHYGNPVEEPKASARRERKERNRRRKLAERQWRKDNPKH